MALLADEDSAIMPVSGRARPIAGRTRTSGFASHECGGARFVLSDQGRGVLEILMMKAATKGGDGERHSTGHANIAMIASTQME
jgi:hypothetical protein